MDTLEKKGENSIATLSKKRAEMKPLFEAIKKLRKEQREIYSSKSTFITALRSSHAQMETDLEILRAIYSILNLSDRTL